MIYFADISIKNIFILYGLFEESDIQLNVYRGDFLSKEFDDYMKNVWKIDTFDVIVGNPPYNNNIDLKFLSKYYDICNKYICIVHPSTWILDKKFKNKEYNSIRTLLKLNLEKLVIFNGTDVFGVRFRFPLVLTYISKYYNNNLVEVIDHRFNKTVQYNSIFDINIFSNNIEFNSIKNKITEKSIDFIELHKNKKEGPYIINLSTFRGNIDNSIFVSKDFFSIFATKTQVSSTIDSRLFISFDAEIKAANCLKYLKTNFARMALGLTKSSDATQSGELTLIPYLDFTQEWTDEKLYKEFNITKEEQEFINKHIEPYYD